MLAGATVTVLHYALGSDMPQHKPETQYTTASPAHTCLFMLPLLQQYCTIMRLCYAAE